MFQDTQSNPALFSPGPCSNPGWASSPSCETCQAMQCVVATARDESKDGAVLLRGRAIRRIGARQVVFHEGTPADYLYVLCQGEVKLSVMGPTAARRIVHLVSAERTPGEVLDTAALAASTHSLTCETLTDCQLVGVAKRDLSWLLQRTPAVAGKLLLAAGIESGSLLQQIRNDWVGPVRRRMAQALLTLSKSHGFPVAKGIRLTLSLRRQEWAELAGTSRETVARLLHAFQREGTIALDGRRIVVLRPDALAQISD